MTTKSLLQGEWTPLHFAAWTGQTATVELLIAAGANVYAKDVSGGEGLCMV